MTKPLDALRYRLKTLKQVQACEGLPPGFVCENAARIDELESAIEHLVFFESLLITPIIMPATADINLEGLQR
jgi:hypothetical protein